MKPWQRWLLDALERTARTFVQGFLMVWTLDAATALDADWGTRVLGGAVAGGYSVLMSFAAKPVGAKDSASLLPEDVDPPQPDA